MKAQRCTALLCALVAACGTNPEPSPEPSSEEHTGAASTTSTPPQTNTNVTNTIPETVAETQSSPATAPDTTTVQQSNDGLDTAEATDTADTELDNSQSNSTAPRPGTDNTAGASDTVFTDDTASDTSDSADPHGELVGEPVEVELTPVPIARGEHGVGAVKGEVYVLGGFTPTVTSSVQAYAPESDQWRDVANFPVVFHHPNIASVNDQLYVLGFHAGSGQRQADGSSYAYDPEADVWTELTRMPPGTERGASCVTTYQDKVYVFGGTNGEALPDASIYDPATDEWETLPFVPAMRHHCVAAHVNDKIYIVSGRDVVITEVQAESYVFDPVAKTYTEVTPILTPRGGSAGGLLFGRIFVFGGEGNSDDPRGIFHEAEMYDPATDMWQALPNMKVPRHGLGGAVIGNRLYLPAGSLSQGIDVTDTFSVFYYE